MYAVVQIVVGPFALVSPPWIYRIAPPSTIADAGISIFWVDVDLQNPFVTANNNWRQSVEYNRIIDQRHNALLTIGIDNTIFAGIRPHPLIPTRFP